MTVTEKVAYIKGLVDGLDLDAKKDEVKLKALYWVDKTICPFTQ